MKKLLLTVICLILSLTPIVNFCSPSTAEDAPPIGWIRQFGTTADDYGFDVAVDALGNAYVVGYANYAFLRKYGSDGVEQWTRQFGTTGNSQASGVAVDSSGNVYVVGQINGAFLGYTNLGDYDVYIRKYSSDGIEQWTSQFGTTGQDWAAGIAVDNLGNVYVAGEVNGSLPGQSSAGSDDAFVRKYNSAGVEQWTRQFGSSENDWAAGVAVDSSGNAYVVGYTMGAFPGYTNLGSGDAFIRKYSSDGVEQWTRQFGSSENDWAGGIAVDALGNACVAGGTMGAFPDYTNSGFTDAFVRKYNSAGTEQWTHQFGTANDDQAIGIILDASDNVYLAGNTGGILPSQSSAGGNDAFVRKYSSDGVEQWTRQFGSSENDWARGIVVDSLGNLLVAGNTWGTLPGQNSAGGWDTFVVKFGTATRATTVIALLSSHNPSRYGQEVNFTANVSAEIASTGIPTGTITFKDGAIGMGAWNLSDSGQATCSTSTLSTGNHTISADYSGDSYYAVSTSNLAQIVNQGLTTTNLTSSANPSTYGRLMTFNATVIAITPASGIPTGTVTFNDATGVLGTWNLSSSGHAICTTSTLSVGGHTISAVYNGDNNFAISTGTFIQTVNTQAQFLTGWNTFSTPIALDPASSTLGTILSGAIYDLAYRFNAQTQSWETMNASDQLKPCDALYVHMNAACTVNLVINPNLTSPPSKALYAGWNLISLASMEAMKANLALSSVDQVTGGLTGYTQVLSQAVGNQFGWSYVKGQTISDSGTTGWMQPYEGYWVFMVNSGTLGGFTTTPLNGGGGGGTPTVNFTSPTTQ